MDEFNTPLIVNRHLRRDNILRDTRVFPGIKGNLRYCQLNSDIVH